MDIFLLVCNLRLFSPMQQQQVDHLQESEPSLKPAILK
jgi:hypothetical protein